MHIKKLIIDGFKSYGKRTEIDGFDKEFTAITGLNGTGKSNILDSICFVLGITNLTQVKLFAFHFKRTFVRTKCHFNAYVANCSEFRFVLHRCKS